MFRSLVVRQIRIDMEMMGQTEKEKGRKEGGKERKGVLRRVISSKISVIVPDCCLTTYTYNKSTDVLKM